MKYVNLINLNIQHQYFNGEQSTGIAVEPTGACSVLLKKFNLLYKANTHGFDVYRPDNHEKITTVTKLFADLVFDFKLFVSDPKFCDYTLLPVKKNDETYLFSNQTTGKKSTDNLVTSTISKLEFDENTDRYLLGLVRLRVKKKPPIKVLLNFTAKAVKWKFYILSNAARGNFVIDGKLSGQPFSKMEDTQKKKDTVVMTLNANYPSATVSLFESDKTIAFSSKGCNNIQLRNEVDNALIIKHLPNPAIHQNGIQIINLLD